MATPQQQQWVIDRQSHRVYTLAYYTLGSREDAEDVTQEVLVRYWKHATRIDPQRVEGWLVRVTTNACLDLIRKRRTRREAFGSEAAALALAATPSNEPAPSAGAESTESAEEIRAHLAQLREPYRGIVILREVQGMTYQQIAEALEMPLSRVKVYLHRGRRMLAKRLQASEEPDQPQGRQQVKRGVPS